MRKLLAVIAGLVVAAAVQAQSYPSRPVKVIVPWPPGQATDLSARLVAQKLQETLGQPFVVDNRPGAGGAIGTGEVVRAAPDGYTLLASSSGPISIMPAVQKTPYEPLKDLTGVSLIAAAPFALVTAPSFPANNAREFVGLVRASPDKFTFASSGTGATAHLIAELFNSMAQLKARHIPYKGSAPGLTDVMNGQVSYTLETVASVVGHVKAGRVKALGVTSARRSSALPDVPPLAEAADLPGFDIGAWIGYSAPAGTPREVLTRLSAEIQKAMQAPEIKERYLALGMEPVSMAPDEMNAFLKNEGQRYADIARKANVRVE